MLLEISAYKNNNKKKVLAFIGLNTSHTHTEEISDSRFRG